MATAPRPGVTTRNQETEAAQTIITITVERDLFTAGKKKRPIERTHALAPLNIPMRERIICRKATGLPMEAFVAEDRIALDSLVVLWWMARRANGESNLTFDKAAEEWPDDIDIENELVVDITEPDDDSDEDDSDEVNDSPEG